MLVPCSLCTSSVCDLWRGKGKIKTWDEFVSQVVYMHVRGWKDVVNAQRKPEDKRQRVNGCNGSKNSSSVDVTTYLCYSPTCTPAQLSLLSEAIARYSAFLERRQKKHADYERVKHFHSEKGTITQQLWLDDIIVLFFLTGERFWFSSLLTREEDDNMRRRHGEREMSDKDVWKH